MSLLLAIVATSINVVLVISQQRANNSNPPMEPENTGITGLAPSPAPPQPPTLLEPTVPITNLPPVVIIDNPPTTMPPDNSVIGFTPPPASKIITTDVPTMSPVGAGSGYDDQGRIDNSPPDEIDNKTDTEGTSSSSANSSTIVGITLITVVFWFLFFILLVLWYKQTRSKTKTTPSTAAASTTDNTPKRSTTIIHGNGHGHNGDDEVESIYI